MKYDQLEDDEHITILLSYPNDTDVNAIKEAIITIKSVDGISVKEFVESLYILAESADEKQEELFSEKFDPAQQLN